MTYLIDFVENSLELGRDELLTVVVDRPGQILAGKRRFLGLMTETWQGDTLLDFPELRPGDLRPVFGGEFETVSDHGLSRNLAPGLQTTDETARRRRLEIQSLLLYAHSVAVRNPFTPRFELRRPPSGKGFEIAVTECSDAEFLLAVFTVCDTAVLESASAVQYFTPPSPVGSEPFELTEAIAGLGRELYEARVIGRMVQDEMFDAARRIYGNVVFQLVCSAFSGGGASANLLIPSDLGEDAFGQLASHVLEAADVPLVSSQSRDTSLLSSLTALQLPGVEKIRLREMAAVRDDDSFSIFRADMRDALEAVTEEVTENDYDAARAVIGERMTAALSGLDVATHRGVISDAIASDAVGWGVGAAAAGAVAGWQSGVAALIGTAAADIWRKYPTRSRRALRAHYVALSDSRAPATPINAERLRSGEVRRMWGFVSMREKDLLAQRKADAMNSLLESLGDPD